MKKLFKNCPHEEFLNCNECELFKDCIKRKQKRIAKRKAEKRKRMVIIAIIFGFLLMIVLGMSLKLISWAEDKKDKTTHENETESTTEIIVEGTTENTTIKIVVEQPKPRISADSAGEVYYYIVSEQDKIDMAKVVYREARGELFEGQVAVAAVILNRYYSDNPFFTNETINSVITQPYQFASIDVVDANMLAEYPDCMKAVEAACKGWDPTRKKFPEGACFFYDPDNVFGYQKKIRTGIEFLEIGNHNFHNDFNE